MSDTTFDNQNARKKIRLEMDNGVLLEVPIALVMRALAETWREELGTLPGDGSPPRVCFGVPPIGVSAHNPMNPTNVEPEMLYLTLSFENPRARDKRLAGK